MCMHNYNLYLNVSVLYNTLVLISNSYNNDIINKTIIILVKDNKLNKLYPTFACHIVINVITELTKWEQIVGFVYGGTQRHEQFKRIQKF